MLDIEAGDESVHGTSALPNTYTAMLPLDRAVFKLRLCDGAAMPCRGRAVQGTTPWIFLLACMIFRWELYRERARECEIAAENADLPELRGGYLELAQKWRQLADEIEHLDPSAAAADRLTA